MARRSCSESITIAQPCRRSAPIKRSRRFVATKITGSCRSTSASAIVVLPRPVGPKMLKCSPRRQRSSSSSRSSAQGMSGGRVCAAASAFSADALAGRCRARWVAIPLAGWVAVVIGEDAAPLLRCVLVVIGARLRLLALALAALGAARLALVVFIVLDRLDDLEPLRELVADALRVRVREQAAVSAHVAQAVVDLDEQVLAELVERTLQVGAGERLVAVADVAPSQPAHLP